MSSDRTCNQPEALYKFHLYTAWKGFFVWMRLRRLREEREMSRPLHKWHLAVLLIPIGLLLLARFLGGAAPPAVSWLYRQSSGTRHAIFLAFEGLALALLAVWGLRLFQRFRAFVNFCCFLGYLQSTGQLPEDLSELLPGS